MSSTKTPPSFAAKPGRRGVTVGGGASYRDELIVKARELVALARKLGYRPEELAEVIEHVSVS